MDKIALDFKVSEKHVPRVQEVRQLIREQELFSYLAELINRSWVGELEVSHADLGSEVKWREPNKIEIDFENSTERIVIGILHEFAHVLLHNPPWWEDRQIQKIIDEHSDYQTKMLSFDFKYAVEQTLSALLQSAAEEKLGIRPLKWQNWRATFEALDVEDLARQIWPEWLEYLEEPGEFDAWLAHVLQKT